MGSIGVVILLKSIIATQNLLRIEPGTGTVVEEEEIDEMIY